MIVECEHCGEILGKLKGNVFEQCGDVNVELTGKVFARRQLIALTCPVCKKITEVLE